MRETSTLQAYQPQTSESHLRRLILNHHTHRLGRVPSNDEHQSTIEEQIRFLDAQIEDQSAVSRDKLRDGMLQLERRLCEKFKILRKERGWSQAELSERMAGYGFDLHQTTIAKLEAGTRPLRVAEMYALSHIFQMPPGAVFFMARSDREVDGMDQLTEQIAEIERRRDETQSMLMRQLEQTVEILGDFQTQRNELVDAMRRVASEQPAPEVAPEPVIELMDALKQSISAKRGEKQHGEHPETTQR